MAPEAEVSEILTKMREKYLDSHISLNNKLTELQDDDVLEDIFEEGDVLTAFRRANNNARATQSFKNESDAIVVLVDRKNQPMFIKSGNEKRYKWKALVFKRTITVFR